MQKRKTNYTIRSRKILLPYSPTRLTVPQIADAQRRWLVVELVQALRRRGKILEHQAGEPVWRQVLELARQEPEPAADLPESLRDWGQRVLLRSVVFGADVRYRLKPYLPPHERHLSLLQMIVCNPGAAEKCLRDILNGEVLEREGLNVVDFLVFPDENPLRDLDHPSGEGSVLDDFINTHVFRPVFKHHQGAIRAIHDRSRDDDSEIQDEILCALRDKAKMRKAVARVFGSTGNGVGMLRKIVECRLIDQYRSVKNHPYVNALPSLELEDPVAQRALDSVENDDRLTRLLPKLTKESRELVRVIRDMVAQGEKLSAGNAAKRLGISRTAAWKRIQAMKKQTRALDTSISTK